MSTHALIALGAALLTAVVFAVTYAVLAPWPSTPYGRNLMANAVAVAALLGLIAAEVAWDNYPGRDVIQTVVLAALAGIYARRTWLLVRTQRPDGA